MIIREWTRHYNRGRPHSALGPGLPEPMSDPVTPNEHRHMLPLGYRVAKRSVLGGLHHEYGLVKEAAWQRDYIFADYRWFRRPRSRSCGHAGQLGEHRATQVATGELGGG
jgi:hypothetical protein